ncbi:hypothetical protein [Gynuella sunshinyii]|uniref:Uncharacterized protein n=1 Tax=Gynuella sunshinyii YC6258 TaxID=1445510 RepID=A0A0C5VVV9_9GAMM|nr:hypothetical protein [Gynuella sunshinyii]AJQ97453.1 hypothetical Protein YC6258_05423 [Gynuella sunshinyii YC6258]
MSDPFTQTRKARLIADLSADQRQQLQSLSRLEGVEDLKFKNNTMVIRYSAARQQWSLLQQQLDELAVLAPLSRLQKIRFAYYRFVDENTMANANARISHCCNKPPVVPKRK